MISPEENRKSWPARFPEAGAWLFFSAATRLRRAVMWSEGRQPISLKNALRKVRMLVNPQASQIQVRVRFGFRIIILARLTRIVLINCLKFVCIFSEKKWDRWDELMPRAWAALSSVISS